MSDGPLSPEEVAHRGFGTTFRGFDTGEVRTYLQRVANDLRAATARERELHRRLADAEQRAAHPVIEGETLTRALGDEMACLLARAQEASNGLKQKAEENSARILREAHDQAQRIRAQAESILAVRTEEADAEAAEIRRAAQEDAAGVIDQAGREAAAAMAEVEGNARQLVHDAQAARARVLGDLTRRRRLLQTQVEQLRAGRERLLDAYRMVRSTTDDVADELQRVENEAREAAGAAAERVAADPGSDELDDVLAAFPGAPGADGTPEGAGPVPGEDGDARSGPVPAEDGESAEPVGDDGEDGTGEVAPVTPVPPDVKTEVAAQPAGQAAQLVSTRPGGDGRSLRLLRRPRPDGRPLDLRPGSSGDEGVRVIAPGSASAASEDDETISTNASIAVASGPADGEAEEAAAAVAAVDELFARIRAGRADAVARAHEVLDTAPDASVQPPAAHSPGALESVDAASSVAQAGPGQEEAFLRQRDTAIEGIELKLARKLKRALQDEQNEVLDRLRSAKAGAGPDTVLLAPDVQAGRYRQAAEDLLRTSAAAGADFVASEDSRSEAPDVVDVVADLVVSLIDPLRRALERAVRVDGSDQGAIVERIGAAYRECKSQRIEGLAGDAVTAAFSRGLLAAMSPGAASRWVVDDDGRPCPDCDDNALAGPTPAGEAFPTGQSHPPAHAGCRCVLAPAEVSAAVQGPADRTLRPASP